MPLDQAEFERRRARLKQTITGYVSEGVEAFVRPDLGPHMAFEPLRGSIAAILTVSQGLLNAPLEALPFHVFRMAETAYSHLEGRLSELKAFDVVALSNQNVNIMQHHLNVSTNLEHGDAAFWEQITPVLGFIGAQRLENDPTAATARSLLRHAEEAVAKATAAGETIDQIVGAAREASIQAGVSKHAALFAAEADRQEQVAKRWLVWTGIFTLLTLLAAGLNLLAHINGWENPPGVAVDAGRLDLGLVLAKVFAFSILLSAIVWCGRIYKAAKHNAVVNRHRQNALSTFQSFVEGGTDDQTRNAVLLQAAQSVFAPQISGFVTGEPDAAGPAQLIEMVRTIGPGQK